ncbi:class I SAM-dependent methyltransferase [Candidatus Marinimicrobia bacterium]|nr:class I SAM-dependent methyltransferase [Candidatus Neomarinimicrobiota bacterium]
MYKNILDKNSYIDRENHEKVIGPSLKNYNNHIVDLILSVHNNENEILDFGAGCGTLAKIVRKKLKKSPTCIEIDEYFKSILIDFGFRVFDDIEKTKTQYDFIYSSNVLEHINDDIKSIKQLESKLTKNGTLVLYLPAFQILFSDLDRAVGHFRRYSKKRIIKITSEAGFKVDKIFYVDSVGFLCSFIIQILGWNTEFGIGSKNSLKLYDKLIFPVSRFLDSLGFKYILGKNIFVSLKKSQE